MLINRFKSNRRNVLPFGFDEECSFADALSYPNASLFQRGISELNLGRKSLILDNISASDYFVSGLKENHDNGQI